MKKSPVEIADRRSVVRKFQFNALVAEFEKLRSDDVQVLDHLQHQSTIRLVVRMSGTGIRQLGTIEQVGRDARSRAQLNP